MPRLMSFWYWGADTVTVTTPAVTVPAVWTTLSPSAQNWTTHSVSLLPRFEHVYRVAASGFGKTVSYEYAIQSEYPFIIASDGVAVIESTITIPTKP